jgi:DNA-binding response OmpR family regulator
MTRVLILEAEQAQIDQLDRLLVAHGAQVEVYDSGRAGLARAQEAPPALVVVGSSLEDMSAFRVCRELRRSPQLAQVPVFLLGPSGSRAMLEDHSALARGADAYFEQPLGGAALWEIAGRAMEAGGLPRGQRQVLKPGARVLLVESDQTSVVALLGPLQAQGCQVEVRARVEGAWASAQSQRPDLVIVGSRLPDHSGFLLCWRMRRDEVLAEVPVFLVVSDLPTEALEDHSQLRSHADAYFLRPFDAQDVLGEVGSFLPLGAA